MFETETVRSCLVQKLKWEEGGMAMAPCPPSGCATVLGIATPNVIKISSVAKYGF